MVDVFTFDGTMPRMACKYSEVRVAKIVKCISEGSTFKSAAHRSGIHLDTFYSWVSERPDFRSSIEMAVAEREASLVGIVRNAASEDWRAAKWLLARSHEGWSEKARTSEDDRRLMDKLSVMEKMLTVKAAALRVQALIGSDDYDVIDILNEIHGIEEKVGGARDEGKSESSSGEGDGPVPEAEVPPDGRSIH